MKKISEYIENLIVENHDFKYHYIIDNQKYKHFNISIIYLTIIYNNKHFNTQPILYGNQKDLQKLSHFIWNTLGSSWVENSIEKKSCYSLKKNILIPEMTKLFNLNLGNILDIGSYNGEIIYLIKKEKQYKIEQYTGIDIIDTNKIKLFHISNNQHYIQNDINDFTQNPKNYNKYNTIFISMTLLNIIDIENLLNRIYKLLTDNGYIYIVDINSNAYQALGFFYKNNNEWYLKQVFKNNKIFYTLKKLSNNFSTIHCFHPVNLYKELLEKNNFIILNDYFKGPTKEDIIKNCSDKKYQKDMINKMSKYIKYPVFHFIKAKKHVI